MTRPRRSPPTSPFVDAFRILLRSMTTSLWRAPSPTRIGPLRSAILRQLVHGPICISTLRDQLGKHLSTISGAVRNLERLGLVTRQRGAFDDRIVLVCLTARGHLLAGPTEQFPALIQAIHTALTPSEQHRAQTLLRHVLQHLTDSAALPPLQSCETCLFRTAASSQYPLSSVYCSHLQQTLSADLIPIDCPTYQSHPTRTTLRRRPAPTTPPHS